MKQFRNLCSLVLSAALILSLMPGVFAAEGTLNNFQKVQTYSGQFADVPAGEWYTPNVQAAFELSLMKGNSDTQFNPRGEISVAEALALACRVNSTYHYGVRDLPAAASGPWYQNYVDYAVAAGILYQGQFSDYSAPANRAQFAMLLASALPESALPAINTVENIPDVPADASYAWAVYRLYNAGILAGSDAYGTFHPFTSISRAESAAIITRMADASKRVKVTLKPVTYVTLYNIDGEKISVKDYEVSGYQNTGWYLPEDYIQVLGRKICTSADEILQKSGNYAAVVDFLEGAMAEAEGTSAYNIIAAKRSEMLASWQKENKCPVAILGYTISENSIGTPEVNITLRNLTNRDIKAFEVEWACVDAYGKITADWPTLYNGKVTGYMERDTLYADEVATYTWTLYSNTRTTSIQGCHMVRIAFADGSIWPKSK